MGGIGLALDKLPYWTKFQFRKAGDTKNIGAVVNLGGRLVQCNYTITDSKCEWGGGGG